MNLTEKVKNKTFAVTEKAKKLLVFITKNELYELLKISKVTLNNRLAYHTWTVEEEAIIDHKLNEFIKDVKTW